MTLSTSFCVFWMNGKAPLMSWVEGYHMSCHFYFFFKFIVLCKSFENVTILWKQKHNLLSSLYWDSKLQLMRTCIHLGLFYCFIEFTIVMLRMFVLILVDHRYAHAIEQFPHSSVFATGSSLCKLLFVHYDFDRFLKSWLFLSPPRKTKTQKRKDTWACLCISCHWRQC